MPRGPRGEKRPADHIHALSLYFVWYNWVRLHKTTRVTPAIATGLTDRMMDLADVVRLFDEYEERRKRKAA